MTTTPRTDAIAHRGYNESAYIAEMTDTARELEREIEFSEKTGRQIWAANERLQADKVELKRELADIAKDYRHLAELLDGHDATECRANLVKLKLDLAAERALADRLASSIERMPWIYGIEERQQAVDALKAWKEARRETV